MILAKVSRMLGVEEGILTLEVRGGYMILPLSRAVTDSTKSLADLWRAFLWEGPLKRS